MSRTLQEAFAEIDLSSPEIPAHWEASLRECRPWLFCAGRPPRRSLLEIDSYFAGVVSGELEHGLVIGFESDDRRTAILHYYLSQEDLVVLVQMPWGNAAKLPGRKTGGAFAWARRPVERVCRSFTRNIAVDHDPNTVQIRSTFSGLAALLSEWEAVRKAGAVLTGRLAVVLSCRTKPFWGWIPPSAASTARRCQATGDKTVKSAVNWAWYFDNDVFAEAQAALKEL